jgi:hypothetical protein
MADMGLDPLPGWRPVEDDGAVERLGNDYKLTDSLELISPAAHHFVTSSLANQPGLLAREGDPFVEIHLGRRRPTGHRPGDACHSGKRSGLVRTQSHRH